MTDIPLVDLRAQHAQVADEVARRAGRRSSTATAFVGGPEVGAFEREFADVRAQSALRRRRERHRRHRAGAAAAGVGAGDEVVLPANTFVATAEAVVAGRRRPRCSSTATRHLLMDADAAGGRGDRAHPRDRCRCTSTGRPPPVERLRPIAGAVGRVVVEDAAQAQGARRTGAGSARSATSPRRASTRARTSAPTATAVRC